MEMSIKAEMEPGGAIDDRAPTMTKRELTVTLSRLASEALAGEGQERPQDVPARLESALRCYLPRPRRRPPAWPYPGFLKDSDTRGDVALDLSVDGALWLDSKPHTAGRSRQILRDVDS